MVLTSYAYFDHFYHVDTDSICLLGLLRGLTKMIHLNSKAGVPNPWPVDWYGPRPVRIPPTPLPHPQGRTAGGELWTSQ